MLIYFDLQSRKISHTIDGFPDNPPSGDYIEVPDGTGVNPTAAYEVMNGQLVHVDILPSQKEGIDEVNVVSGETRKKFVTPITGQEMIYQEKEREARDYVAATPEPNTLSGWENAYPFIAAEVGSTASTPMEVAQIYLNLAAQWRIVGSQLEQLRISTISNIEVATTPAEIDALIATFNAAIAGF